MNAAGSPAPYETITSINRDYAQLLRHGVQGSEHIFDPRTPLKDANAEIQRGEALVLPTHRGFLSPWQVRADEHLKAIRAFWDSYFNEYTTAIATLPGLTAISLLPRYHLAAYFDTVLIEDTLYAISRLAETRFPQMNLRLWSSALRDLYRIIPLLEVSLDPPPIALAVVANAPKLDSLERKRAEANIDATLAYLSKGRLDNHKAVLDLAAKEPKHDLGLDTSFNWTDFCDLFRSSGYKTSDPVENAILYGGLTNPPAFHFANLVQMLRGFFIEQALLDSLCLTLKAEPLISRPSLYRMMLRCESQRLAIHTNFNPEMAVPITLELPPMRHVRTMAPQDLIKFREAGAFQDFRSAFAAEQKRLKFATVEDFEGIAESVRARLAEIVVEEDARLKQDRERYQKQLGKSILSLTSTVVLSVVSIAVPPLAVITVPLAAWSVLIGSVSARDVVNLAIKRKAALKEIRPRPIGAIAEILDAPDH